MTELLVLPAVSFTVDPVLEASGTGPAKQAQRAGRASNEALAERIKLERETTQQLLARLATLKKSLEQRLLVDTNALTDFRAFTLKALTDDVDRMVTDAAASLATTAERRYQDAADLGIEAIDRPITSTGLTIDPALPGLDPVLVQHAFGNTVDLLSPPMQQFSTDVKLALRGVALAGDSKFGAITKLKDQISGAGFDTAQYKAERIIRTELGRTFNGATFDRLVGLSGSFPFLKKGWRASQDNRTRKGHLEAAAKYARGSGIPIKQSFSLNVYDERPGKGVVLIGVCLLRFPVDPQAQPGGRVAAAATILCRCNAFVDFDLADFAQHAARAIQQIVPGVPAGTGVPPVGTAGKPKLQHRVTPAKATGVKVPKAKDVVPAKSAGPAGKPVTAALDFAPRAIGTRVKPLAAGPLAKIRKAYQVLDSVHGDGELPVIPVQQVPTRNVRQGIQAFYSRSQAGKPVALAFGPNITKHAPNMGVFHETGHFLDNQAFGTVPNVFASEGDPLFTQWQAAVKGSKAMQTLADWRNGTGRPLGANDKALDYLLSGRETFARSYAQYIAVKSGDKLALKELRNMQAASSTGAVDFQTKYNRNGMGQAPVPGTWDYPWAWSDEDFKPIEAALDAIFESKGWRKR